MAAVYAQSPSEQPRRSGAPKVFGILSIIFASIMTLGSFFVFMGTLAANSLGGMTFRGSHELELANAFKDQVAGFYTSMMFQPLILLVLSAMLLAIGIGQVTYKRWAQKWSVIWGWCALAAIVVLCVLAFAILAPAYDDLLGLANKVGGMRSNFSFSGGFGTFVGVGSAITMVLFLAPYPILLIAFFNGKKVRDAMTR